MHSAYRCGEVLAVPTAPARLPPKLMRSDFSYSLKKHVDEDMFAFPGHPVCLRHLPGTLVMSMTSLFPQRCSTPCLAAPPDCARPRLGFQRTRETACFPITIANSRAVSVFFPPPHPPPLPRPDVPRNLLPI